MLRNLSLIFVLIISISIISSAELIIDDGTTPINDTPIKPPIVKQNITYEYTPTTTKKCIDGVCNIIVYPFIRNVYEDNIWKPIEQARSLKGSGIVATIIEDDPLYPLEVLDYNYTSITLDLKKWSILNTEIPIKIYDKNTSVIEEVTYDKDLNPITTTKIIDEEVLIKEDSVTFNIFDLGDKEVTYDFSTNKILHFGENSTTVILEEPDSEVLEDTYVRNNFPTTSFGPTADLVAINQSTITTNLLFKFNISMIPLNRIINNATINFYISSNGLDAVTEGWYISAHHVYNTTWIETNALWTNTFNTTNPDSWISTGQYNTTNESTMTMFGGTGEPTAFQKLSVKNMLSSETSNSLSVALINHNFFGSPSTTDTVSIKSKEETTVSLRPFLNITYTETINPPDTFLISPENNSESSTNKPNFTFYAYNSDEDDLEYNFQLSRYYNFSEYGWDISTLQYTNTSFNLDYKDSSSSGMFFKPDGTKMYMIGYANNDIHEFNLTDSWNISSLVFSQTYETDGVNYARAIFFKPDGTKMYTTVSDGSSVSIINQYNLTTAWDISTSTYVGNINLVSLDDTAIGLYIKPDGTKMYFVGQEKDFIFEYNLTTAWEIPSSAIYNKNYSVSAIDGAGSDIFFKPDGTKMYFVGYVSDRIYEFNLPTKWDISNPEQINSVYIYNEDQSPLGLYFRYDGLKAYVMGGFGSNLLEYNLNTTIPLIDKYSNRDLLFQNINNATDIHPFNSRENITYTIQNEDELENGDYYWRVRSTPNILLNQYGDWSEIRLITINVNESATSCNCPSINTNWEIDMSDFCIINDDCDLGTGNITFINEGWVKFNSTINLFNLDNPITNQIVYINPNGKIFIG